MPTNNHPTAANRAALRVPNTIVLPMNFPVGEASEKISGQTGHA